MTEMIAHGDAPQPSGDWSEDGAQEAAFKPWSKEQAQTWRKQNPPLSPWRVVAAQFVAGLVCAAVAWAVSAREHRPAAELIEQPYAGCVLALEVDVPGLPVNFAH